MKIFTDKGIFKKLIFILVAIILFSTIVPTNVSFAADSDPGGVLLKPIVDLMLFLGDVIMDIIHNVIYDMPSSIIKVDIDADFWEFLWITLAVIAAIAIIVAVSAALVHYIPLMLTAIGGALKTGVAATALTAGTVVAIGGAALQGGVAAGMFVRSTFFSNEAVFPMFQITPEEIFKGNVALLDVNFFKDEEEIKEENSDKEIDPNTTAITNKETVDSLNVTLTSSLIEDFGSLISGSPNLEERESEATEKINKLLDKYGYSGNDIICAIGIQNGTSQEVKKWTYNEIAHEATLIKNTTIITDPNSGATTSTTTNYSLTIEQGEWVGKEIETLGLDLKSTVAKWYYAIRNFALVVMMVILVYIGIRIMLCSVASEKAKYKNMLFDWIVAICLIFIMHYIMAFSMNLVDGIIKVFGSVDNASSYTNYQDDPDYLTLYENTYKIEEGLNAAGVEVPSIKGNNPEDGTEVILWDTKNIVGMVRIQAALENSGTYNYIGYVMCYLVLVFFTVFFLFTYLKRALYLTFFTIIAPLVAMTYPLDKLHDGKAQAFDMWFKEYIFNLMIQPVHLLLYTVLISSAFELATENILYTLVAIGFMMPAEKFIRKMFGFDKAQTPGFLSGATGTALMVTAFNKLFNRKPSKGGGGYSDEIGDGSHKSKNGDKIPMTHDDTDPMLLANGVENAPEDKGKIPFSQKYKETQLQEQMQKQKQGMEMAKQRSMSFTPTQGSDLDLQRKLSGMSQRKGQNQNAKPIIGDNIKKKFQDEREEALKNFQKTKKYEKLMNKQEKLDKRRKKINAIKAYCKSFAGQTLQRSINNWASGKPIRDFANFTRGAYMGLGGLALGSTFALASDKPVGNMTQYGGTLAAAAYAVGSRDSKPNYDANLAFEEAKRAQFDNEEEYQKYLMEEERKKVTEDEKNLRELRTYLRLNDTSEAKEKLEDYGDCIDAGFKDMEDLATIIQLTESGKMDKQMAKTAAKYYKKAGGKPKNMGEKALKDLKFQYSNIVRRDMKQGANESNKDYDARVDATVKIMLANLDLYGSTKDNLTEI